MTAKWPTDPSARLPLTSTLLAATARAQSDKDVATEIIPLSIEQVAARVSSDRGRLSLLSDGGQTIKGLAWTGTLEQAQADDLKSLSVQKPFSEAIAQLLDGIKNRKQIAVLAEGLTIDPPPPLLAEQLKIGPKTVTWTGPVTAAQMDALKALTGPVEYLEAIREIVGKLETTPVIVEFGETLRPAQKDLPDVLRGKLLLGGKQLEVKALLRSVQACKLRKVFTEKADLEAITRFYEDSVFGSLKRLPCRFDGIQESKEPFRRPFEWLGGLDHGSPLAVF